MSALKDKIIDNSTIESHIFNNWENYKVLRDKVSGKMWVMLKDGAWVSPTTLKSPSGSENKNNKLLQMSFSGSVEYTFSDADTALSHFTLNLTKLKFDDFGADKETIQELMSLVEAQVKEAIEVAYL